MTVIDALESDNWEDLRPSLLTINLAADIMAGLPPTQKPSVQIVSRIHVLMVRAKLCTDDTFMEHLEAKIHSPTIIKLGED